MNPSPSKYFSSLVWPCWDILSPEKKTCCAIERSRLEWMVQKRQLGVTSVQTLKCPCGIVINQKFPSVVCWDSSHCLLPVYFGLHSVHLLSFLRTIGQSKCTTSVFVSSLPASITFFENKFFFHHNISESFENSRHLKVLTISGERRRRSVRYIKNV